MRKSILLILFLVHVGWSSAATWTIGPNSNFIDINAAMKSSSVKDGDVLRIMNNQVVGSPNGYQTVTKSVTIEGPGIVYDANGKQSLYAGICNLYLQEDGIVLSKLLVQGNVSIRANDVTIEKCLVYAKIIGNEQNYDSEDFTLRQCYVQDTYVMGQNSEDQQGWRIMNNIFSSRSNTQGLCIQGMNGGLMDHNIFYTDFLPNSSSIDHIIKDVEDCTITNNIITRFSQYSTNGGADFLGTAEKLWESDFLTNNTVKNNVISGTSTYPNNKGGISKPEEVFIWDALYTRESSFALSAASPAKGYATDGGDCGPWDGEYPYLLGGIDEYKPIVNDDFQVESNDLLALKNMYNAFGGANWTKKKWSFASNGKSKDDFPGVTFNSNGRVTAIDLQDNGLEGKMFSVYSPSFEELTSLNLSRNALTGDIGLLIGNLGKLQTLNLSYNGLSGLSTSLPSTCNSVDMQYQNRIYGNIDYLTDNFYKETPVTVTVNTQNDVVLTLPSLYTYYKSMQRGIYGINGPSSMIGMLNDASNGKVRLSMNSGNTIYTYPQDTKLALIQEEGQTRHSAYPIILHYEEGDADMNGKTNVLDVQYTLNYILAPSTVSYFNYSAANTYSDSRINVQDIVVTVNLMLSQGSTAASRAYGVVEEKGAEEMPEVQEGTVLFRDGQLLLTASRPVAAIDVEFAGVSTDEVGLMLPSRDFQMIGRNTEWGSRYVIFSSTGKSIPANTDTPLLRLAASVQPVSIMCSDPEAKSVEVAISSTPTGIKSKTIDTDNADTTFYDLQGRRSSGHSKGLYIVRGRKVLF